MKPPFSAFFFVVALIVLLTLLFGACSLPSTYSLTYGDGKQSIGASVRFEGRNTLSHDGKTIQPLH